MPTAACPVPDTLYGPRVRDRPPAIVPGTPVLTIGPRTRPAVVAAESDARLPFAVYWVRYTDGAEPDWGLVTAEDVVPSSGGV